VKGRHYMGLIHINELQPGMVLEDEVKDLSGRLLLGKGKKIQPEHFRVFKIWGVTEVKVLGNNGSKKETILNLDPEQIEKIKNDTLPIFSHNDLEHPAIKEIFRLSVLFRHEYKPFNEHSNIESTENNSTENLIEKKCIKKITDKNLKLPEVPSIVFDLNEIIADPISSADDIAKVVQKSPSLTAILLKFANSPFYGFSSQIDKISLAVTLIGTREISGLALGLSILSTFDKIPKELIDMFSFLRHSVACGIISRILATHKGLSQTEHFFVSGLLHDLGRLIFYCNYPEDSKSILSLSRTTNNLLYKVESDYFNCNHSQVAKRLIQQWKLPLSLENNIVYHHNPFEAQQSIPATLVHLADIFTNGLGIGTSGERFVPPLDTKAWNALNLSPTCFDNVIRQATHQFFALESMFEN